jgi:hypothetical protein
MICTLLLMVMIFAIATIAVALLGIGGATLFAFLIAYADVILFITIIVLIVRHFVKKKKKN